MSQQTQTPGSTGGPQQLLNALQTQGRPGQAPNTAQQSGAGPQQLLSALQTAGRPGQAANTGQQGGTQKPTGAAGSTANPAMAGSNLAGFRGLFQQAQQAPVGGSVPMGTSGIPAGAQSFGGMLGALQTPGAPGQAPNTAQQSGGGADKPPGATGSTGQGNPQRTQMLANQQMNQRNAIQAAGGNPGAYTAAQLAQLQQMTGGTPSAQATQNAVQYAAPTENAYQQGVQQAQNAWNQFAGQRQSTAGVPQQFQPGAAQHVKPTGAAGSTGGGGGGGGGGAGGPSYQDALNAQFGQGNPFGQRDWYGGNPLETAQAAAERAFQKQLAGLHAQYAGYGTPGSARQSIAEGTAIGEFGTGLGNVLAQLGEGAYQNDATRGLNALIQAGQLQNQNNANVLQANQQLANLGTGLTGLGSQEQGIPNLGDILALLGAFQSIMGQGTSHTTSQSGGLWYP